MVVSVDLIDLESVAAKIIAVAGSKRLICFNGEMGAGKTTLIKAICKLLGSDDVVTSPTFGIVNEYAAEQGVIYHFDAYRLNSEEEAYDFGIEEYLDSGDWCLIEWPEKIENLLPSKSEILSVTIFVKENRRLYEF